MQPLKTILFVVMLLSATLSHGFCFQEAGLAYQIDPIILKSIAIHESRLNAGTVVSNTNDTYDIGLMGINTVHLKDPYLIKAGFRSPQDLIEPCTNVMIGAWLLSRKFQKWGKSWQAIGAYHSETPDRNSNYQSKIYETLKRIQRLAPENR